MTFENWERVWQDGGEGWAHKYSCAFVPDLVRGTRTSDQLWRAMQRELEREGYGGKRR